MISEATWQATLDIPHDKAWQILQDLSQAHNYVPGIIDTKITTEQLQGVGASRNVYQGKNRFLQETVTEWDEGKGFKIRLHKGEKDSPFKNAYFRYEISAVGEGKTNLTTTMGYQPPMGFIGEIIDRLFLNKIISGVIRDVALSMKHYYETGQATQKADLKRLKKAL